VPCRSSLWEQIRRRFVAGEYLGFELDPLVAISTVEAGRK